MTEEKQVIVVCRHGARFDYAHPDRWRSLCERSGSCSLDDPPLSNLGKTQAEALGQTLQKFILSRGGLTRIVSSPYLRCIETAMPTGRMLGLDVILERQLAEVRHRDNKLPKASERLAYFPYLVFNEDQYTNEKEEEEDWPIGYMWRMALYARRLRDELDVTQYSTTLLFSHAASVALVAALCESKLCEDQKFHPAGAFFLVRDKRDEAFRLHKYQASLLVSSTTKAWHYSSERLKAWHQATNMWYPPGQEKLPVLDITDGEGIREACEKYGAFYLKGALDQNLCLSCAEAAKSFFAESIDTKKAFSYEKSPAFRGYMAKGTERTKGSIDAREQIEIGPKTVSYTVNDPIAQRLIGPNQWPNDALRSVTERYIEASQQVASRLIPHLGAHMLEPILSPEPYWQAKIASYPPSGHVGAHTDSGLLTLLWQDAPGLEVCVDGKWLTAPPIADTIICTAGEMLQLASNGRFRAAPHRVHASALCPRLSLPFFYNPSLNASIETSSDLLDQPKYNNHRFLGAYGRNAFKSLARSHPAVFAEHHPDLTVLPDGNVVFSPS